MSDHAENDILVTDQSSGPTVLALVTEAFGGPGGIAQYNRDFLGGLAALGAKVCIQPRFAVYAAEPPPGVWQRPARPSRAIYLVTALAYALRREPTQIVFCGHLHLAPLAFVLARLLQARLVVQLHGIEAWSRPTWLQRGALERADLVLCVSRDTRIRLLHWTDKSPRNVAVLANTVRPDFTPGDQHAARRRLDLLGGPLILSVGRLSGLERYKGQDRVIEALPSLLKRWPGVTYLIAGEGEDQPRLAALADCLAVSPQVKFLGQVADELLPDLYRAADLFLLPSTGEGFGIVFLEAMACGVPALGLGVAGACDALLDGRLGRIADAETLAAAIAEALEEPGLRGHALAQQVDGHFGRGVFHARLRTLMQDLLRSPPQPASAESP